MNATLLITNDTITLPFPAKFNDKEPYLLPIKIQPSLEKKNIMYSQAQLLSNIYLVSTKQDKPYIHEVLNLIKKQYQRQFVINHLYYEITERETDDIFFFTHDFLERFLKPREECTSVLFWQSVKINSFHHSINSSSVFLTVKAICAVLNKQMKTQLYTFCQIQAKKAVLHIIKEQLIVRYKENFKEIPLAFENKDIPVEAVINAFPPKFQFKIGNNIIEGKKPLKRFLQNTIAQGLSEDSFMSFIIDKKSFFIPVEEKDSVNGFHNLYYIISDILQNGKKMTEYKSYFTILDNELRHKNPADYPKIQEQFMDYITQVITYIHFIQELSKIKPHLAETLNEILSTRDDYSFEYNYDLTTKITNVVIKTIKCTPIYLDLPFKEHTTETLNRAVAFCVHLENIWYNKLLLSYLLYTNSTQK